MNRIVGVISVAIEDTIVLLQLEWPVGRLPLSRHIYSWLASIFGAKQYPRHTRRNDLCMAYSQPVTVEDATVSTYI